MAGLRSEAGTSGCSADSARGSGMVAGMEAVHAASVEDMREKASANVALVDEDAWAAASATAMVEVLHRWKSWGKAQGRSTCVWAHMANTHVQWYIAVQACMRSDLNVEKAFMHSGCPQYRHA